LNAVELVVVAYDVSLVERDIIHRAILIDVDTVGGLERTTFIDWTSEALSPDLLLLELLADGQLLGNE